MSYKKIALEDKGLLARDAISYFGKPFPAELLPYINEPGPKSGKTAVHRALEMFVQTFSEFELKPYADKTSRFEQAKTNLMLFLANGADLAKEDLQGISPIEPVFLTVKLSLIQEFSKIMFDPQMDKVPIARLRRLFLNELQDMPFIPSTGVKKLAYRVLAKALSIFVEHPHIPVVVKEIGGMKGLYADRDCPAGVVLAGYDGMVFFGGADHKGPIEEEISCGVAYLIRNDLQHLTAIDVMTGTSGVLKTHSFGLGTHKEGALLMICPTGHDISHWQTSQSAGFANEGSPNAVVVDVGNSVPILISLRSIRKNEQILIYYGSPHAAMDKIRGTESYLFDAQSFGELVIHLRHTAFPPYIDSINTELSAYSADTLTKENQLPGILAHCRHRFLREIGLITPNEDINFGYSLCRFIPEVMIPLEEAQDPLVMGLIDPNTTKLVAWDTFSDEQRHKLTTLHDRYLIYRKQFR